MKILVTGASGFVGENLAGILAASGLPVKAAGRVPPVFSGPSSDLIEAVCLDFNNPESYAAATADADRVFLVLPMGVPVESAEQFIRHLGTCKLRLLAFLSFAGSDRNSFPPHHRIEKAIEAQGIPYVHLRPGFLMENLFTAWAGESAQQKEISVPMGFTPHALISSADVAAAAADILRDPARYRNTSWNLSGAESLSFGRVADLMGKVSGQRYKYRRIGLIAYRNLCAEKRKMDGETINRWVTFFVMAKMGAGKKTTGDFTKITGKKPMGLEEFLKTHQMEWSSPE